MLRRAGAYSVAVRAVLGGRLSCGSLFALTKNKCFDLSQKNSFLMQKTK